MTKQNKKFLSLGFKSAMIFLIILGVIARFSLIREALHKNIILGGEVSIKIFFGLISILLIFAAYAVGQNISQSGLVYAALVATGPTFVQKTVDVWQPTLIPFLILVSLIFLQNYKRKQQIKYLMFSILTYAPKLNHPQSRE